MEKEKRKVLGWKIALGTLIAGACILSVGSVWLSYQNYTNIARLVLTDFNDSSNSYSASAPPVEKAATSGSLSLKQQDGKLVCTAAKLPLMLTEDIGVVVTLPNGVYDIVYDMLNGYLKVASELGELYLRPSDSEKKATALYSITDANAATIISGDITQGEYSLFVVAKPYSEDAVPAMKELIYTIESDLAPYDERMNIAVNQLSVNEEWGKAVIANDEFVLIKNADDVITVSPYKKSLEGAGLTNNTVVLDKYTFAYGDYYDAESGLRPYILQEGDTSLKIMAKNEESLHKALS